ncbi:nucleotidyltransferase family protein [Varunaivibrio sulfuroxidans]|uniref:Molybdenum cofactor cytidylyltransferase n=1 Tax=Varunaivibrio sulfuroxidans TaxID=1773489 RepID=A0A4R3JBL6_9PROT|nr:nucleotidyltransferase family protein [Varunaivibrio sulfuroxidans]TCS63102.1 molybdenum cofactor cytidylyltransferase [Varunaivibrio sulfuroxidans]WES31826.1 nucleotidyltransferase family protein [Varunaivibrio sulfuroxidans]
MAISTVSITAVLLAAGRSRRFGSENKLLADMGGAPMVRRTAERLCAGKAARVVVVVGHEGDRVAAALAGLPVAVVRNARHRDGLASSVRAGLAAVDGDAAGAMMCLADQPLLEPEHYNALIDAFAARPGRILVPYFEGKRGNPVILPAAILGAVLGTALEGGADSGFRVFIDAHPDWVDRLEMGSPAYTIDFDTPRALAALDKANKDGPKDQHLKRAMEP